MPARRTKFCPKCGDRTYGQSTIQAGHTVRHCLCGTCDWQKVVWHTGPKTFKPRRKKVLSTVVHISFEAEGD